LVDPCVTIASYIREFEIQLSGSEGRGLARATWERCVNKRLKAARKNRGLFPIVSVLYLEQTEPVPTRNLPRTCGAIIQTKESL
jgi:hypothetical protein